MLHTWYTRVSSAGWTWEISYFEQISPQSKTLTRPLLRAKKSDWQKASDPVFVGGSAYLEMEKITLENCHNTSWFRLISSGCGGKGGLQLCYICVVKLISHAIFIKEVLHAEYASRQELPEMSPPAQSCGGLGAVWCIQFTGTMLVLVPRRFRGVGYQQVTTQCLWRAALSGRSQVIPLCNKGGVPVAAERAVSETKRINTKRSRGEGRGL